MKRFIVFAITALILTGLACNTNTETKQENMKADNNELNAIFPKGEPAPDEYFTGNAYPFELVAADSIYTTLAGNVYFEPGARSNWHTHPSGQILIITDGVGYSQIEGQEIKVIKKGDVVKYPPNVRHWHGASPDTGLQQLYIIPNTEKGIVEWMEPVTDEFYNSTM
jgi:quercetin dioxygenase-like cupin family protein